MPDRVRLTFDRTDTCTQSTEVTWITDTQTELAEPIRWTLAGLATVVIGVPVAAGVVVAATKAGAAGGAAGDKILEIGIPVAAVVILAAGGGGYAGSGVAIGQPGPTTQRVEVVLSLYPTNEKVVPAGSFSIEGGATHPVLAGAVELTLEDALALRDGQLLLDGAGVDIVGLESGARLRTLPACRQALLGFDASAAKSLGAMQKQARLAAVDACRSGGWSFADRVMDALTASSAPWLAQQSAPTPLEP